VLAQHWQPALEQRGIPVLAELRFAYTSPLLASSTGASTGMAIGPALARQCWRSTGSPAVDLLHCSRLVWYPLLPQDLMDAATHSEAKSAALLLFE